MPIRNCPLTPVDGIHRPILYIRIINPHTNKSLRTYGIVDTGADECAIPAKFAKILGHKLKAGEKRTVFTGNGETVAYSHTTSFEIFHPITNKLLYALPNTPIDFLPRLDDVLLGVNNFLNKFVLKIDYPHRIFSIKSP